MSKGKEYWITNISNMDINVSDLGIKIPAKSSVNLLGRGYYLTEAMIDASVKNGSIHKRQGKLFKREVPPGKKQPIIIQLEEHPQIVKHQKSCLYAEEVLHEELNINDVQYAEENSDLAEEDHMGRYKK